MVRVIGQINKEENKTHLRTTLNWPVQVLTLYSFGIFEV